MKILASVVSSLLIFNSSLAYGTEKKDGNILPANDLQRLARVIGVIKNDYYKSCDDATLFTRAISGMLASLDPHSAYLDKEALQEFKKTTWGRSGNIGAEIIADQGFIKVISPLDDTPAYRAGMKPGDTIVQIDNKFVRDMSSVDANNMLGGKKGSNVRLVVIRKNETKPLVFNLRRELIKFRNVKEQMLEPGYGYIRIALFKESTVKDLANAVKRLKRVAKTSDLKGMVLDIRNNPGGLADPAIQVADSFLDSDSLKDDDLIVYAKGQNGEESMAARANSGDILSGVPIVLLINEGSAAAAEIVAGALQDHKRAILVGTKSFGKGSMQTIVPIDDDSALKLTTALYYTPHGRSIQAKGIEPDITVEDIRLSQNDNSDQDFPRIDEAALVDHIQNGDASSSNVSKNIERRQKQSKAELALAYKDYQLYEALHILKSQNVTR